MQIPAELLPDQDWVLVGGTVTPDPAGFGVTLRFADGQIAGKGPVNRYSGPATVGAGMLSVGELVSTKMAGPPDAMAAEQAYFASLSAATGWDLDKRRPISTRISATLRPPRLLSGRAK